MDKLELKKEFLNFRQKGLISNLPRIRNFCDSLDCLLSRWFSFFLLGYQLSSIIIILFFCCVIHIISKVKPEPLDDNTEEFLPS